MRKRYSDGRTSRRHLSAFLVAALAAGCALTFAMDVRAGDTIRLSAEGAVESVKITKGKPQTIRSNRSFSEIVVGNPEIADVRPLTDRTFYILGNGLGTTGIALYDDAKRLVGSIDVEVTLDTIQLKNTIRQSAPGSDIKVSSANGRIMLSGTATDAVAAKRAEDIAGTFSGGEGVINSVKVSSSQQVQLAVRFIEASREAERELGVQLQGLSYGFPGASPAQPITSIGSGTGINLGDVIGTFIGKGFSVDFLIKAMEQRGLARTLAEPNLVARSGETATFLAGGEFPIPVASDENTVTVEFKKYGVGLDFTPTVLDDGMISLVIEPEVSQVDPSSSYRINDISIPGFSVRRAKTSVDLRSGQSFVIAGLLQTENTISNSALPGLGNLPVLGPLFSSKQYRKRETDLVIIVTPHLVQPIKPGVAVATPFDAAVPPASSEFGVLASGEVPLSENSLKAKRRLETARASLPGLPASGHILDIGGGTK